MLACTCCFLSYCALICCRSGPGGEEAAGVQNVFASRRYEMKKEIVKDEKPLTPPQTQPRRFLAKLVPSFSVLKPVLRPLRPLWAKIRTIRPSPPPLPLQQTTTLMTRPIQLVQTTAVAPKLMMQQQIKVGAF